MGKHIDIHRLSEIFFELKEQGANNINLVTGDMFIPSIREAIDLARLQGFDLPFLLNTSSYLNADVVRSLEGLIDIYLPDMKYIRNEDAIKYSNAPGYVEAAKAAIDEMVRQQPECVFYSKTLPDGNAENLLSKGVVIRHLLMPGMLIQAKLIVSYLHKRYEDKVYLSLMNQFTPNEELSSYPEINRKIKDSEYNSFIDYAAEIGVTCGFMQTGETAKESFIPDFDCRGV